MPFRRLPSICLSSATNNQHRLLVRVLAEQTGVLSMSFLFIYSVPFSHFYSFLFQLSSVVPLPFLVSSFCFLPPFFLEPLFLFLSSPSQSFFLVNFSFSLFIPFHPKVFSVSLPLSSRSPTLVFYSFPISFLIDPSKFLFMQRKCQFSHSVRRLAGRRLCYEGFVRHPWMQLGLGLTGSLRCEQICKDRTLLHSN